MANPLTEKMGPMPVWAWLGIVTVVILVVVMKKKGGSSVSSAQAVPTPVPAVSVPVTTSSGYGNGHGGGPRNSRNYNSTTAASSAGTTAGITGTPGTTVAATASQATSAAPVSWPNGIPPRVNNVPGSVHIMPNVLGMQFPDAVAAIYAAGLDMTEANWTTSQMSGIVTFQNPAPGTRITIPAHGNTDVSVGVGTDQGGFSMSQLASFIGANGGQSVWSANAITPAQYNTIPGHLSS